MAKRVLELRRKTSLMFSARETTDQRQHGLSRSNSLLWGPGSARSARVITHASSISIRTSCPPTPNAIRWPRWAASNPLGHVSGRPRIKHCSRAWTRQASTRPPSCRRRPPTAMTTAMWPMPSPPFHHGSPEFIRSTSWHPTRCKHSIIGLLAAARACACSPPAQRCRTRPRGSPTRKPIRSGSTRRPKAFPSACRCSRTACHCCGRSWIGFPRSRSSLITWPARRSRMVLPTRTPGSSSSSPDIGQVYLKITPFNVTPKSWGKATPDTFFAKLVDTFGASRIAWGSNFPNSHGTVSEILAAARQAFSFARASDQDWIFGKTALTLYPTLAS